MTFDLHQLGDEPARPMRCPTCKRRQLVIKGTYVEATNKTPARDTRITRLILTCQYCSTILGATTW